MKAKVNKNVVFISAQPDIDYFVWQVQVQMNNFKKHGIEKQAIILFSYDSKTGINPNALKLKDKTKANVLFYPDDRSEMRRKYIPTVRPNIIKKFYVSDYSLVNGKDVFYHDSDILFRKLPDFKMLSEFDGVSLSDTISYIGSKYIIGKSVELFREMCAIVGIDPEIVINNELSSGGAQYFIPSKIKLTPLFWNKVERDSVELYNLMTSTSSVYKPEYPIQAWTADMWSLLWNIWLRGYASQVSNELSFSWATDPIGNWEKHNIFHNAGVVGGDKDLFNKGEYINKSPFGVDFSYVSKDRCSSKYVEEIVKTAKLIK